MKKLQQQQLSAFRRAKVEFQSQIPTEISIARNNQGMRIGWRLANIMAILKIPLADNELTIAWGDFLQTGSIMTGHCNLGHVDGHSEESSFGVDVEACFGDLLPAQRLVAAVTLIKRVTLEAVTGIATGETDAELNEATYSAPTKAWDGSNPPVDAAPSEPPKPLGIDPDELEKLKKAWRPTQPESLFRSTKTEIRGVFYDWATTILSTEENPVLLTEDADWTMDRLFDAMHWIKTHPVPPEETEGQAPAEDDSLEQ